MENKNNTKISTYEGLQTEVRSLVTPDIEVWDNQYQDREYVVTLDVPECSCICPKTGLPDFIHLKIDYSPVKTCVELKSFKLYVTSFRDVGIFHEHITNRILDDFVKACQPRWAKIMAVVNPRGGITTTVTAEYRP